LVRHGQSTANAEGVLAGWSPGVELDDIGHDQAESAGRRLGEVRITGILTSPLEPCRQTAEAVAQFQRGDMDVNTEVGLAECRYGDWTGQSVEILMKDPLWDVIQSHPSGVSFPGGESLAGMQARAIAAIRRWNRKFGPTATYVAVTHGDVVKAVLADALGMHLDLFQRIRVDLGSISAVHYDAECARVALINDLGGDLGMFSRQRGTAARPTGYGTVGGEA
jgi:probable phosphomutase (TIGR03848 family)